MAGLSGPRPAASVLKAAQRVARRLGLSVMRYRESNYLMPHLQRLFEVLEVNCVLDVGANTGQFVDRLRRELGYRGHVASFEPARAAYEQLTRRLEHDASWRGFRCALGREHGTAELNLFTPDNSLNSMLQPSAFGSDRFAALRLEPRKETVEVRRLDDVFADAVRPLTEPVTFLKLDTQGFDIEVLHGATGVLGRIAALVTELPVQPIYEGMPSLVDALGNLDELGFEVTGMFPVTRDRDGLGAVEFDCVLRARSTYRRG
jgi:FkbM family methyltransferase